MNISFIIPSRNNLKYLQQAYFSIKNSTQNKHEIVMLDDASTDDTWLWMNNIASQDHKVVVYRNNTGERVGHTILYDKGIELSTEKAFCILHADMVVTPNFVTNLTKHLKKKHVISATRIEPPLHPPGVEKHTVHFGFEPEEFKLNVNAFNAFVVEEEQKSKDRTTQGIFAPWCMFKEDFIGHDPLFAPMELEDSDIFNRFFLAGYTLLQSRDSLVYHMTCRGSRFKDGITIEQTIKLPDGTDWFKPVDSKEYLELRNIKFREWYRKWHQDVLHDENMLPIVKPVLNVGFHILHCNVGFVQMLEPFCDNISVANKQLQDEYIEVEQPTTMFNLTEKFRLVDNDVEVHINAQTFTLQDFETVKNLGEIMYSNLGEKSGVNGTYKLENLTVVVNTPTLKNYSKNKIHINNEKQ